jgi:hypothetical protein
MTRLLGLLGGIKTQAMVWMDMSGPLTLLRNPPSNRAGGSHRRDGCGGEDR